MFVQMLQNVWANGAKLNIIKICVNMKPKENREYNIMEKNGKYLWGEKNLLLSSTK